MGIFDSIASIWTTDKTNKANRKMVDSTNAANAALWREQSAYNTPANQMKRLEAAGLNPNLAYGQIAESRASNPPTMAAPQFERPQFSMDSTISQWQQVKNLQALNQQTTANTERLKAEAIKSASDADYSVWENERLKEQGRLKSDTGFLKTIGAGKDYISGVIKRIERAGAKTPTKLLKHVGSVELDHALLNAPLLREEYGDQFDGGQ